MKKIIDEKDNFFSMAFVTGDSAAVVNAYTSDARLFPPNEGMVLVSRLLERCYHSILNTE
jgi:hypothetical protein